MHAGQCPAFPGADDLDFDPESEPIAVKTLPEAEHTSAMGPLNACACTREGKKPPIRTARAASQIAIAWMHECGFMRFIVGQLTDGENESISGHQVAKFDENQISNGRQQGWINTRKADANFTSRM